MATPDLKKSIRAQDWEETSRILKNHPELAEKELSIAEFTILWKKAPLETILAVLRAWPEAHKQKVRHLFYTLDLVEGKSREKEWDFLDKLFVELPHILETTYARTALTGGASNEFLNQHWKETGTLLYSVHNKDWEETSRILQDFPHVAKDTFSEEEFNVLWYDAPLEIIQVLLKAWPEAHEMKGRLGSSLFNMRMQRGQWEFLKSIIHAHPNVVKAEHVGIAARSVKDVPIDVFRLMLDQQPNAPLEYPSITFDFINDNRLERFCAVLDRCPAVTDLKNEHLHLTPLLFMFQKKERINVDWIGPILNANPNAAMGKDFDGKISLHLAYQHEASSELIDMIIQAYPEGENERDNLGRFPKDLANPSEKKVFTPTNMALIVVNDVPVNQHNEFDDEKSFPDNAVVVCRGDMLIRDPQLGENDEDKKTYDNYLQQVLVRQRIFRTLLEEFSKMVGIDNKDVIQKAAAIQALAAQWLSNKNGTVVNFGSSDNPGYWFQQEILKLVTRIFHEPRIELGNPHPSILHDAEVSMKHLDDRANGTDSLNPSDEHVKAYNDLTKWLTEGLDINSYSMQGPVLKPLQSLFNKLFIRRGQTSVSIIGDLVRATLLVDDIESLQNIIERIKGAFPNITGNQFRQPNEFDKLADFLTYVHDDLDFIPDSHVLPYRFKANSSQKKKDKPLWYNMNFFLQIPEYHRVGFSEMFVACELQIGLTEEVNKHRQSHVAYERDRILLSQPLLKNYDTMKKEEEDEEDSQCAEDEDDDEYKCTEDDNKMIEKVLFGKMASEVLIPCTTVGNDNEDNILLFENGPFSLSRSEIGAGSFVKPERLCLNNRSFNWFASDNCNSHEIAFHAAVPYKLDATKRYFVDSFLLKDSCVNGFHGTVGLYAHVGPYLIQITCAAVRRSTKDIVMIKSGQNFSYLEQMCPVPIGTTALEVIAYGRIGEFKYDTMELSLKVFDVY